MASVRQAEAAGVSRDICSIEPETKVKSEPV